MRALIMAGGLGTRFWPKSRREHPKQLLKILGEQSLILDTVERLKPIVTGEEIYIVAMDDQLGKIRKQLNGHAGINYLVEPKGKNTAPCIGLAAVVMQKDDPDAVMVVLPADHLIEDNDVFLKTLQTAEKVALETGKIVTIGIEPNYPATGYGYIQFDQQLAVADGMPLLHVKTFAEKPNVATAERFLSSGDFLWNSGMFVWKVKTILEEIEEHLPQVYDGLMEIRDALGRPEQDAVIRRVYSQIRSISIDYGVMEHAKEVTVLKGNFGWNDLGSWGEVYKLMDKDENRNVLVGSHLIRDAAGCLVDAPEKCVALVGVDDLVVVDTPDALLICRRDRVQEVRDVVDLAKRKKMDQIL